MPTMISNCGTECADNGMLFNAPAGTASRVAPVNGSGHVPFTVTLDNPAFDPWTIKAVFVRAAMQRAGRQQFLYTLGDVVFAQAFGENMGVINLSGIAFAALCGTTTVSNGVYLLLSYYDAAGFGQSGLPVFITFGGASVMAFLTGMSIDAADPATGIIGFTFQLLFPPTTSTVDAAAALATGGTAVTTVLNEA